MIKLFTKTWINDFPWFKLALKSVLKMCKEPVQWFVSIDDGTKDEFNKVIAQAFQETGKSIDVKVFEAHELWRDSLQIGNGYLRQQWVKMTAHRMIEDGTFWNWDSDVVAVRPFDSNTFRSSNGKPIYWFSQLNHLISSSPQERPAHEQRRALNSMILDFKHISFEFMRGMPMAMEGQILRHAESQAEWGRAFSVMRSGDNRFSEFNLIGQFCHLYYPDAFDWKNADNSGPSWSGGYTIENNQIVFQAHAITIQSWSWGGVPEILSQYVNAQ